MTADEVAVTHHVSGARQGESKRDRILSAAEALFAQSGYHGTAMRDIAREAEVGLPLIVYHFETKENLYTSVFTNRAYVNDERLRALRDVVDLHSPGAVKRIVSAFVDPMLDLHERPGDIWYARLILREVSDPTSESRPSIRALFDPISQNFVAALRIALPEKPAGFHEWAYLFSLGALTMSAFDDRVGRLAGPRPQLQKREYLKNFIEAGLLGG